MNLEERTFGTPCIFMSKMNGQMQSKLDKQNIFNFNVHVAESWLCSPQLPDYSFSSNNALGKNNVSVKRQFDSSLPLFVRLRSQMCQPIILALNLTNILWSDFFDHDCLQTCNIKLESSEAYLLKLGKICRGISKLFSFFVKMRF